MAISSPRDANRVPALIAVSSADGVTPLQIYGNSINNRLMVDATVTGGMFSAVDGSTYTAGVTSFVPLGGFYHSTIDTVADGKAAAVAIDSKRNMFTVLRDAAGNARGANVNASNQLSVSVDNFTATVTVVGSKSTNAGVPGVTNLGTLPALANAAAPTLTEGNQVSLSTDLSGNLRVSGTVTANAGTNLNTSALALDASVSKLTLAQGSTTAAQTGPLIQAAVTTASPTYTTAQTSPLSLTTAGALRVDASATTQPVNVSQINGVVPLMGNGTTGTGSPRVTISSDNTVLPAVGAGATGSTVPANAAYNGGNASTALATAATAGNTVGAMYDKFGRQVVLPGTIRDLVGTQTTTISASTAETTIVTAAGVGVFADIYELKISNTSATAARVDIRDATAGSIVDQIYVPAGDVRGVVRTVAWPQTTANNNWTAQSSASVTDLRISVLYAKNK